MADCLHGRTRRQAMRSDITPGAVFPDYELPDHTGKFRHLSEIQAGDPMIIVLAREAYSAKDQRQHEGLVQLWREITPTRRITRWCRTLSSASPVWSSTRSTTAIGSSADRQLKNCAWTSGRCS